MMEINLMEDQEFAKNLAEICDELLQEEILNEKKELAKNVSEIYYELYNSIVKLREYDNRVYKMIEKKENELDKIKAMISYHSEIENAKIGKDSKKEMYKIAEKRQIHESKYMNEYIKLGMKIGFEKTLEYAELMKLYR